jgi:anthranilate phosphoribosyltransferase
VHAYEVTPEEFGFRRATLEDIGGGDAKANAEIIRDILRGKKSARRDVVLLNAAATLVAAGKAETIRDGIPLAEQSLDSGAARAKLEALVRFTNSHH